MNVALKKLQEYVEHIHEDEKNATKMMDGLLEVAGLSPDVHFSHPD